MTILTNDQWKVYLTQEVHKFIHNILTFSTLIDVVLFNIYLVGQLIRSSFKPAQDC